MGRLFQDLRYGIRTLAKSPGFTLIAVITLALGLGANAAIFSVVNKLLLRPYPFPNLDQLLLVEEQVPSHGHEGTRVSPGDYFDLQHDLKSFSGVTAYRYGDFNLTANGEVDSIVGTSVSPNFFEIVGEQPALGRGFTSEEGEEGRNQVAILSNRYWKREFGGDAAILGRSIQINGRNCTIVGIMPPDYAFPVAVEVWIPLAFSPSDRMDRTKQTLNVVGRLKPSVTFGQARAELNSFASRQERLYPATNSGITIKTLRLRKEQYEYTAPFFLTLQVAAIFVLFLACANLANLLYARMISRQKEIAVRMALGADRQRLAQLFLSETMLLSLLAAGAAVSLSVWCVNVIRVAMPVGISDWVAGWNDIRVDSGVLVFALSVTGLVGLAFGLAAAFHSRGLDVNKTLKEGGGTASTEFAKGRLRNFLAVTQVVLAMVLLVGAGSMIRGFLNLQNIFRGFEPANVLTFNLALPERQYPDDAKIAAFYEDALRGIKNLPGVQSAAVVSNLPASNVDSPKTTFSIEGRPALRASDAPAADLQRTSADFFRSLRIPVLTGRAISGQDGRDSTRVVAISDGLARRFWPGENPIGQRLKLGSTDLNAPWFTVVGVVSDVKMNWFDPVPRPTLYVSYAQQPRRGMSFVVRTASSDPLRIVPSIRDRLKGIDPSLALSSVQPYEVSISDSLAPIRIIGILMLVFGAGALILAAVGVYGILAHGVAQRTHEFGIRLALGAQPLDVLKLVFKQALGIAGIGLTSGLALAFFTTRVMASLLYGVVTVSWLLMAGFSLLLLGVALAAGYLPARRAMCVDPMIALRYE